MAAILPMIYAHLTKDGMGIGDFAQYKLFEAQVEDFIRRKTDPTINKPENPIRHPEAKELATQFVEDCLNGVWVTVEKGQPSQPAASDQQERFWHCN